MLPIQPGGKKDKLVHQKPSKSSQQGITNACRTNSMIKQKTKQQTSDQLEKSSNMRQIGDQLIKPSIHQSVIKLQNLYKFPKIRTTKAIRERLCELSRLDMTIGEPEFSNKLERRVYKDTMKYFDATGFTDVVLDTVGYIYEHPCPATDSNKIYELAFSANGEVKAVDTDSIRYEIHASKMRTEILKEEITKWFVILSQLLRKRKLRDPSGMFNQPKFNSYHLLEAFSIFSRPEDFPPELMKEFEDDPEELKKLPYLVEPGETHLQQVPIKWTPWETKKDKMRECLKYHHIVNGIPSRFKVKKKKKKKRPRRTRFLDGPPVKTANKGIQTDGVKVALTLQVIDKKRKKKGKRKNLVGTRADTSKNLHFSNKNASDTLIIDLFSLYQHHWTRTIILWKHVNLELSKLMFGTEYEYDGEGKTLLDKSDVRSLGKNDIQQFHKFFSYQI